jgi:transposase
MSKQKSYTREFREQAVRFVFESIEPDETRLKACERLGASMSVNSRTLYGWVKAATPTARFGTVEKGSVADLQAQVTALKKELREVSRANEILKAASTFFGAELDRQSRRS